METKESLTQRVKDLEGQVRELEEQLAARDALLSGTGEDGWLISCPNPKYNDVTAGVQFKAGRAFIPDRGDESAALVRLLVSDFNYRAEQMSAKEYQAMA